MWQTVHGNVDFESLDIDLGRIYFVDDNVEIVEPAIMGHVKERLWFQRLQKESGVGQGKDGHAAEETEGDRESGQHLHAER